MADWRATARAMRPPDSAARAAALARQELLTKPAGSLGRLEALAVQVAGIQGKGIPSLGGRLFVVMAADHGVAVEGVSAYPQEVTAQMVTNFVRGGAAINVLARQMGARLCIVDVGVSGSLPVSPTLVRCSLGPGTANFTHGPAMTPDQAERALNAGVAVVEVQAAGGLDVVVLGDMGIGNTTAGAAIVAALCGLGASEVVGRGTGVDDAGLARKQTAIERALAVNRPRRDDPLDVLAKVGGFEHGAMAGAMLAAAQRQAVVLVDGLAAAAAALLAVRLCPSLQEYLIAGHASPEPAQRAALADLGLEPLLDLELRLGEGTGAALALGVLDSAVRLHAEMATFDEAGVANRPPESPSTGI